MSRQFYFIDQEEEEKVVLDSEDSDLDKIMSNTLI